MNRQYEIARRNNYSLNGLPQDYSTTALGNVEIEWETPYAETPTALPSEKLAAIKAQLANVNLIVREDFIINKLVKMKTLIEARNVIDKYIPKDTEIPDLIQDLTALMSQMIQFMETQRPGTATMTVDTYWRRRNELEYRNTLHALLQQTFIKAGFDKKLVFKEYTGLKAESFRLYSALVTHPEPVALAESIYSFFEAASAASKKALADLKKALEDIAAVAAKPLKITFYWGLGIAAAGTLLYVGIRAAKKES